MQKLAVINPYKNIDKYDEMSKTELKQVLQKKDTKALAQVQEAKLVEYRVLRMGTTAGVALLTGLLYQKKPALESLMGTPASLDHILAFGASALAFLSEDEIVVQAAEGVANAGLVPLLRAAGRKIGGVSFA
ncbi:hypothetical protein [Paraliomyxa miuraensis]|uniref:hypothetical protein n=1 Tax=Paraliomyxa miuraensis TaxID=376150 RepID=UPI00225B4B29|nr:hypothetical protein [Paraliomyxa miuraensis]MCX4239046.1 hypothetical protein [Paraliomyxa miuraensis]